ncbi:MAG: 4Fe-4S ferredoxin [Chloroflexota bacterium]|nr:MAG: 4Fe-4S ferredoxin [Chloroflexota bacterium]
MASNGRGKENGNVVGAVMVVGGGIAGMQAALDLAESGFKVHLVETKSAIGGHMAQLDKTFPTNDCAMCTISPKLVDVGRHPNINILTQTEVERISGQAGDFMVTVRRQPRYIDINKCTACGDCAQVCPVVIPSRFNVGLEQQRAAHKLYPQAIPNAYAIEKRGIAPCRDACPAHQRAQGYIALIREGRYDDALRVIKEDNPFPGICGRICNHRCEDACNRGKVDEPVNIHALKRFVTDKVYAKPRVPPQPVPRQYEERVAVIGAGPCGLTAAQDLCKLGYPVTVFEALPVAGGMLRVGVPEYRLPSAIVDREVQDIIDLGVELRLNTTVEHLDHLFDEGFKAVLIAVGAHEGIRLPIPGNNLDGVLINTHFLREVRLHHSQNGDSPFPDLPQKRVLVLGGGNVAIDVARTAVRLGAKEVALACLEGRETMPAHEWEIQEAIDEGIKLYPSRSFTCISDNGRGGVAGVECVKVRSFSFDSQGRLELETEPGSEHVLECETVIFSVGQRAGLAFIPADAGVGLTSRRTIAINPNTFAATRPGVFAAGDSVSGTAFVIEAVASGHQSAGSIHRYLRGDALEPRSKPELPVVKLTQAELEARQQRGEIRLTPRVPVPELPLETRVRNFAEVAQGYTDELAQAEAARCLACGICSECLSCQYVCGVGAVLHDMVEQIEEINVGAIILAPGYQVYRAELSEEYGFGRYPNVVTSLQFERLLSASGPTMGHVKRPSDGRTARKIAFLQCVGSRDQSHDYCSAVCCMYAAKEAIMAKEHEPETDIHVFMMDMRAFSKGYEEYYRRARDKYGIKYTRCRISTVKEDPVTRKLILRYTVDDEPTAGEAAIQRDSLLADSRTRPSSLLQEEFDLVVLSVGMEISESVKALGHRLGIELDSYGFCHTVQFDPLQTSQPGIYAIGPFREPKDIPESVVEASGAAARVGGLLAKARHTLTRTIEYPPERDVSPEEVKTAVFVCHCGTNIGGFVNVPEVAGYARSLPNVVHAEDNLYTCSQDSIAHITAKVKELGANRVVVASCTPLTHEPLFQSSIREAGLNPYLFEMANIRNQCSWVHSADREIATRKAKDLVRMAVARASALQPLHTTELVVEQSALVIGGGAAGMSAALSLAEQGFPVHLVERTAELGGNLRYVHYFAGETGGSAEPQADLSNLIKQVKAEPLITLHLETEFEAMDGFKGNFSSTLRHKNGPFTVKHGVIVVATGGVEYKGHEYGYGSHPYILTQLEFEQLLAEEQGSTPVNYRGQVGAGEQGPAQADEKSKIVNRKSKIENVVMIQCVGPAERFCGRICCTTALKNALKLKELNPDAQVTVIYRDIRTYGSKERLYTQARQAGVLFVRYDFDRKPEVISNSTAGGTNSELTVRVWEPVLGKTLTLKPDLLVLSTPMVPSPGARELATKLKIAVDMDDFFLEAHVKLRPVDFASDGIFMCGLAHYPKFLDESIIQAQAAAARAATILSQQAITSSGRVAVANQTRCVGCLTCVRICPYHVPKMVANLTGVGNIIGAAQIEPTICQGCGICVAECPAKAIQLMHYTDAQTLAKLDALFEHDEVLEEKVLA